MIASPHLTRRNFTIAAVKKAWRRSQNERKTSHSATRYVIDDCTKIERGFVRSMQPDRISVIVSGTSGMVGGGVLREWIFARRQQGLVLTSRRHEHPTSGRQRGSQLYNSRISA